MKKYKLRITQTVGHVVYAYGLDAESAQVQALDLMNEEGLLLDGCDVDVRIANISTVLSEDSPSIEEVRNEQSY